MRLADILARRRQPAADRPDRFVGDGDALVIIGQRTIQLRAQYIAGTSSVALGARFTDADNGKKPRAARRDGLGANRRVGLAVIAASLGMPENHGRGPSIPQHLGGNIPGICTRGLGMAVLAAD